MVVLAGRGTVLPDGCRELLREQPRVLVVALDAALGDACVHAAHGPLRVVHDVDPPTLASLIRELATARE